MDRRVLAALALVLVAGGLARGVVAAGASGRPASSDERAYATLAASVARGTYGDRASGMARPLHWPPGAPVLFGAAARLAPQGGVRLVPWIQAVLGVALIAVCFGIGAVAAGPLAGLAAAAVVAAYPPLISLSGTLLSEPLGALLLAAGVLALAWALRGDRLAGFALAGALLGGAVLTRTDHLFGPPLAAIVLALMLWPGGGARRALTGGGMLLAGYLVVLAPWVVYASARADRLVPVTEGSGPALFVGTYLPGDGSTLGMKRALGDATRARFPALRSTPDERLGGSEVLAVVAARRPELGFTAALEREGRANLRRYALGEPVAFAGLMLRKAQRMWVSPSRVGISGRRSGALRALHVALVLGCAGLLLAALILRRDPLLAVIAALIAQSTLLHAIFVANARYNLPLMALLITGGAVAAAQLLAAHRAAPA